ncbi:MAG: GTPase ObgE [Proteobacteria bacterium]|nr:GTPase ObgE [Pseudomonadota bacterium]
MKFVDEAIVTVQSGNGGRGCVSFRRERFVERGGPDGGNGGDGGDVILRASSRQRTLYPFRFQKTFKAKNGGGGEGRQRHGKNGTPVIIEIPTGTVVSNLDTGEIIKDFLTDGETVVLAKGGQGGRGNKNFATSTHRAPKFAQPGIPGQQITLKLVLKLIAEVGIIGLPNAGKSTLISVISAARPKIAEYPFTTITPNIGIVKVSWGEPFAVADIPGLIEGAHKGAGLGTRFLRHIERTLILVHVIDADSIDESDPLKDYRIINRELGSYSEKLLEKPRIVVLNKIDLLEAQKKAELFKDAFCKERDDDVLIISAATTEGIDHLKERLAKAVDKLHETP